jgi:hypothetical protein
MGRIASGDPTIGRYLGSVIRDAKTKILERIHAAGIDLMQQLLGTINLLDPLVSGNKSDLLIAELPQRRIAILSVHPETSSLSLTPSLGSLRRESPSDVVFLLAKTVVPKPFVRRPHASVGAAAYAVPLAV